MLCNFLEHYDRNGDEFFNYFVSRDQTWSLITQLRQSRNLKNDYTFPTQQNNKIKQTLLTKAIASFWLNSYLLEWQLLWKCLCNTKPFVQPTHKWHLFASLYTVVQYYHCHSPDLVPSDFPLILNLKKFLGGKRLGNDKYKNFFFFNWLSAQVADYSDEGIKRAAAMSQLVLKFSWTFLQLLLLSPHSVDGYIKIQT